MNNVTVSTTGQQDVTTPWGFIERVCEIWPCDFDLAATRENKRFAAFFTPEDDSLSKDWSKVHLHSGSYLWLNPPFRGVSKWMEKCAAESQRGAQIVTLTLASIGTVWYHKHVRPNALSLVLLNRLTFEGHKDPYPKELMLNIFGNGVTGEGYWDWKAVKV